MKSSEVLLTPAEAANRLRLSRRTIIAWLQRGRLGGIKVGNQWRIREDELAHSGHTRMHSAPDDDAVAWLDAELAVDLPAYDWGPSGVPDTRPVRLRKGKLVIEIDG
ncbi:MAG: helix-turn-helix domain-containing protein [Candidatus Xenobia bacterium]